MAGKSVVVQVWKYVKSENKWWLLPLMGILLAVGALLVFAHGSALAPFIYSLF